MVNRRLVTTAVLTGVLSLTQFVAPYAAAAAESAVPVQQIVDLPSYRQNGLTQSEIYQFKAGAGPLRLVFADLPADTPMRVVLESADTGAVLLDEEVTASTSSLDVDLPGGSYSLALIPHMAGAVTLHGNDLELSPAIPGIRFPEMEAFATRNERFSFEPELLGEAASLKLLLGESTLVENMLRADGTVAPVTIDPATMEDGLYLLTGLATAKGSDNLAISARSFLVDRVDSFGDVPASHWARRYVEIMKHLGIINGRSEGQFAPGQPVTRAEFAKMLALSLGLQPGSRQAAPFADVPDDWAKPYIDAVYEQGLIKGEVRDGQSYYNPNRTITRAEAATIVGRVVGAPEGDAGTASFSDWSEIPDWARPAVVLLADMQWINGFPDGRYQPMATLQRDQAAKILANFIGVR